MPSRTPNPDEVYRDEAGCLLLYVRTEKRPGPSVWSGAGADDREHFFVGVNGRNPVHKWYLAEDRERRPLPVPLELVLNAGAEARVAELEEQVRTLEAERSALTAVMKTAVGALPQDVAAHLRKTYAQTRGHMLTRSAK
jgi:hypothetical protein